MLKEKEEKGGGQGSQLHLFWGCKTDGMGCRNSQKGFKKVSVNSCKKWTGITNYAAVLKDLFNDLGSC